MKKEDKIELIIAITLGFAAVASLVFMGSMPKNIGALIFTFSTTGCYFFTVSFSQRHYRNKDT